MSNNNNTSPETAIGFMILAGLMFVAIFLFYLALIFCLAVTCVCIWAWNEERELFGETIRPQEARAFVICGIIGAVIVGIFGIIVTQDNYAMRDNVGFFGWGGYILGSLGWLSWYAQQQEQLEQEAAQREYLNSIQRTHSPAPQKFPVAREPSQGFEYASWDDEEPRQ